MRLPSHLRRHDFNFLVIQRSTLLNNVIRNTYFVQQLTQVRINCHANNNNRITQYYSADPDCGCLPPYRQQRQIQTSTCPLIVFVIPGIRPLNPVTGSKYTEFAENRSANEIIIITLQSIDNNKS